MAQMTHLPDSEMGWGIYAKGYKYSNLKANLTDKIY